MSDYTKSFEPTLSKTCNVTIIPMFLTDCDKSHLFLRHGEIQVPGAEDNHSDGDRSRSFGPGDIKVELLANRLATTCLRPACWRASCLPPSLRPAPAFVKTSAGKSAGLRSAFFSNLLLLCARPAPPSSRLRRAGHEARIPFPVLGERGRETGRKGRRWGEKQEQS